MTLLNVLINNDDYLKSILFIYLRSLLKTVLKKGGFTYDFFYDWCTTKPHIQPDDPIYTNDYKC